MHSYTVHNDYFPSLFGCLLFLVCQVQRNPNKSSGLFTKTNLSEVLKNVVSVYGTLPGCVLLYMPYLRLCSYCTFLMLYMPHVFQAVLFALKWHVFLFHGHDLLPWHYLQYDSDDWLHAVIVYSTYLSRKTPVAMTWQGEAEEEVGSKNQSACGWGEQGRS